MIAKTNCQLRKRIRFSLWMIVALVALSVWPVLLLVLFVISLAVTAVSGILFLTSLFAFMLGDDSSTDILGYASILPSIALVLFVADVSPTMIFDTFTPFAQSYMDWLASFFVESVACQKQ